MILSRTGLSAVGRYLAAFAVGNLVWEFAQLPLYTLWHTGSAGDIVFAAVHCTGGDVLIGGAALIGALFVFGKADWPNTRFRRVAFSAVAAGISYTVFSERLNTARDAWNYTALMPIVPGLGTGLAPLAQWLVVPLLAFAAARPSSVSPKRTTDVAQGIVLPATTITTSGSTPDHLAR